LLASRLLASSLLQAQGQVLEGKLAVAADEEGRRRSKVEAARVITRLWSDWADRLTTSLPDLVLARDAFGRDIVRKALTVVHHTEHAPQSEWRLGSTS
jgi:hypothetical protein